MHLKSLFLGGLLTLGTVSAHTPAVHFAAQQETTAQAVFAIQAAIPTPAPAASLATLVPAHQVVPRFMGTLDTPRDAVIGGTVLAVLILGMWFGRCQGSGRKE